MMRIDLDRMESIIKGIHEEIEKVEECKEFQCCVENDEEYNEERAAELGFSDMIDYYEEQKYLEDRVDLKYAFITEAILGLSKEERAIIQDMINKTYTEDMSDYLYNR